MSDRLSRSNSQSHLPHYGQDKPEDKNNNVGTDNKDASAQPDKNTSRGNEENKQARPQLKSKEEKKGGEVSGSSSDPVIDPHSPFGQLFIKQQPGQVRHEADQSEDSSSEDQLPKSPRQQQSNLKEKTAHKKIPKLSLENLGNALKSLASDRREMTVSPRKTRRGTQDAHAYAGTPTTTTPNTTTTTTTVNATPVSRTSNIATVPVWLPERPRPEAHHPGQLNQPASAKSTEKTPTATATITTTTTTTATSASTKTDLVTQSLANNQKTTDQALASKQPLTKGAVHAALLPPGVIETIHSLRDGRQVTGDQIAELLICMESRAYKLPLRDGIVSTILRGAMTVEELDDPENPGKKLKVNIIELVSETLIQKYLNVKDIRKFVDSMAVQYRKISPNFTDEIKNSNFRDLRKNKVFVNLMKPLVDSFIEKFFGKEMKLSSSGFSSEFKNFLQGIDARVVEWAKVTGDVEPDLLLNARKSAIAAYIGTRAITIIMRDQLVKDKKYESDRLDILNGYLNTLLTTQTDDFYFDIMGNAKNQDDAQKNLISAHKKASALKQREKSLDSRREKISSRADSDASISPREKIKSPRKENLDKRSEQLNATRQTIRNKSVSNFIKDSKIKKPDSDFLRYFRESLWIATRQQYQQFKNNPAEYMLGALEKYIKEHPSKLNSGVNFLQPMRDELQNLAVQKHQTSLAAQTTSASSTVVSATQTLQTEDVTESNSDNSSTSSEEVKTEDPIKSTFDESVAALLIAEEVTQRNPNDSLAASEEVVPQELAKSPFDDSVAELPTTEEAKSNVPGNTAAALARIKQAGLMHSPFDDSDSSGSQ